MIKISKERESLLLKIVEWAQKNNKKVETLTVPEIIEAIRCKL